MASQESVKYNSILENDVIILVIDVSNVTIRIFCCFKKLMSVLSVGLLFTFFSIVFLD